MEVDGLMLTIRGPHQHEYWFNCVSVHGTGASAGSKAISGQESLGQARRHFPQRATCAVLAHTQRSTGAPQRWRHCTIEGVPPPNPVPRLLCTSGCPSWTLVDASCLGRVAEHVSPPTLAHTLDAKYLQLQLNLVCPGPRTRYLCLVLCTRVYLQPMYRLQLSAASIFVSWACLYAWSPSPASHSRCLVVPTGRGLLQNALLLCLDTMRWCSATVQVQSGT